MSVIYRSGDRGPAQHRRFYNQLIVDTAQAVRRFVAIKKVHYFAWVSTLVSTAMLFTPQPSVLAAVIWFGCMLLAVLFAYMACATFFEQLDDKEPRPVGWVRLMVVAGTIVAIPWAYYFFAPIVMCCG